MQLNRRDFIRSAAVTGAGALLSRSLAAQEAAAGAKDEITVALIGIGNQGKKLLEYGYKIPGVRFVAVCDIWKQQNQRRGKNYLKAQMKRDKKTSHGSLRVVLPARMGHVDVLEYNDREQLLEAIGGRLG